MQKQQQANHKASFVINDAAGVAATFANENLNLTKWRNTMTTLSNGQKIEDYVNQFKKTESNNMQAQAQAQVQVQMSYIVSGITSSSAVISNADDLFLKQQDFDIRTNLELYNLLAGVYNLYQTAIRLDSVDEIVKEMKAGLKCVNVKTQKNTPNLTVFVRYVYRADRKKAYNYSQVLLLAEKKSVSAQDLAEFIIEAGGIEACKREMNGANSNGANDDYDEKVNQLKKMEAIASVDFDHSSVDLKDDSDLVLVIARTSTHGKLELLNVVTEASESMLKSAIKKAKMNGGGATKVQGGEVSVCVNADSVSVSDNSFVMPSNPYLTAAMQATTF